MRNLTLKVSILLVGSGFCALVYQIAWFRLFRQVFGASTAASAAVMGIFMAGLGFGGIVLGRRADRTPSPLRMYGNLEVGIAIGAALTPLLIPAIRWLYITVGGSQVLGPAGSTVTRLFLSALVLVAPTFLMGGTLPAATRAVERASDQGRRRLGVLYGANTIGAVTGALWANFVSLEALGTNRTLWVSCLLNLIVAVAAIMLASKVAAGEGVHDEREQAEEDAQSRQETSPQEWRDEEQAGAAATFGGSQYFILVAAGLVGFSFFLMELVWYRMLAPVLGGSSYTFGLILAVALAGIGVGGALYGAGAAHRRPTVLGLAGTCAIEALFIVLPFASGDWVATLAILLRPIGDAGFLWLVGSWTAVGVFVVFAPAVVAGYQFPLLVALAGAGARNVGRQVGQVYAWNTVGALLGSLAGGFGLLPLLSAPGTWRAVVLLLLGVSGWALVLAVRHGARTQRSLVPAAVGLLVILLLTSEGPTAAWRHSPIGAGRVRADRWNEARIHNQLLARRRSVLWDVDGVESSVAISAENSFAVVINGKSDSNVIGDASTTIMSGLIPALLHGSPQRALVIGLGTGGTSGWLAEVPSIERVDTVELEEAVVEVARRCNPATHGAVGHPKVRIIINDGREVVLTSRERYDVIVSEPSNPYRAGIASLFTSEHYRAVSELISDDGLFVQWIQSYEVDPQTVRTVYSTLASVFPYVETWEVCLNADLLLIASNHPQRFDVERLREDLAREPFRSAMGRTWGVQGVEGLFSGYLANNDFARAVYRAEPGSINTDDRTVIEFQFARSVGSEKMTSIDDLRHLVLSLGCYHPSLTRGSIDWSLVQEARMARTLAVQVGAFVTHSGGAAQSARIEARTAYQNNELDRARELWSSQEEAPVHPVDQSMVAEFLAQAGDPEALMAIERLRADQPVVAELHLATYYHALGDLVSATDHLTAGFETYRRHPWAWQTTVNRSMELAYTIGQADPVLAQRLFDALAEPFSVELFREARLRLRVRLASVADFRALCTQALASYEPNPLWTEQFLSTRLRCYQVTGAPEMDAAARDMDLFRRQEPTDLATGLSADVTSVSVVP